MLLKGKSVTDVAGGRKSADTFTKLNRDFRRLPATTETISFRVLKGVKERLRIIFAWQGMTLSEALKPRSTNMREAWKRNEGESSEIRIRR